MIANFFQSLERHRVEYLLISGQATVLYGAATFSEDIDLWIHPTLENCRHLISVLNDCNARYYKLTPPLTPEYLNRGHGFHFVLPADQGPETYLDVIGAPPRVDTFSSAVSSARWIETEWGRLHTIGLKELVELKKTQRLGDYPIISRLALAWLDHPERPNQKEDFVWALRNIFTLETLRALFEEHPETMQHLEGDQESNLRAFGRSTLAGDEGDLPVEEAITAWMQQRMAALQQADRRYWRNIIAELKNLRSNGILMPEGAPVLRE